jgi:hypothetical protein
MKVQITTAQYILDKSLLTKTVSEYPLKILIKKRKNNIGWINMERPMATGKEIILTEGNK